jgi:imidazolonepropionase-like amidohydrolase
MKTCITNARIFDGDHLIDDRTVVIDGGRIAAVGGVVQMGPRSSMTAGQR